VSETAYLLALAAGITLSGLGLLAGFRVMRRKGKPDLPSTPSGRLVLEGSPRPLWIRALLAAGWLCLLSALAVAIYGALGSRLAVAIAAALTLGVMVLQFIGGERAFDRLELDVDFFQVGARRHRWVHVTELRADDRLIRYRLNRALVSGSHWRYWDGAIRNGWGVETAQFLQLLERYRADAMARAPHYLTGRR
jgi:hypothetical protein